MFDLGEMMAEVLYESLMREVPKDMQVLYENFIKAGGNNGISKRKMKKILVETAILCSPKLAEKVNG